MRHLFYRVRKNKQSEKLVIWIGGGMERPNFFNFQIMSFFFQDGPDRQRKYLIQSNEQKFNHCARVCES